MKTQPSNALGRCSTAIFCVLLISSFILHPSSLHAQAPQGFSYQAVVRGSDNLPLPSQAVGFRFSILDALQAEVYTETRAATTNALGMVSLVIGEENPGLFSGIDWSTGGYSLKVEMDPAGGSSYTLAETRPLQSIPYALFAGKSESMAPGKIEVTGDASQNNEEALFEVKRNDGQTVFAVFPKGVQVYVEDDRVKGSKGGFAVGGFDPAKGLTNEYMRVTPDSVRVYIDETISKGSKGGFAVGGFDPSKTEATDLMYLNKDNYFIGHLSGSNITTGVYNTFFGYNAGVTNTTGSNNIFVGFRSGYSNLGASNNVFLGNTAGFSNTTGNSNVFIGNLSGYTNSTGGWNTFLGFEAGYKNNTSYNVFIGYQAGRENTSGSYNTFLGYQSGTTNTTGYENAFLGYQTGFSNTTGFRNVFMGWKAGQSNTTGNYNIFMGREAGMSNTTGTSNVYIGESSGQSNVLGSGNTFIGKSTGSNQTSGGYNVYIGGQSAIYKTSGERNIHIGWHSGAYSAGNDNVLIGYFAGMSSVGSGNVFIGKQAGQNASGWANRLLVENSTELSTPLIYGEFDNNRVAVNTSSPTQALDVNGNARFRSIGSGTYAGALNRTSDGTLTTATSDIRMKENIETITGALDAALHIRGVSFTWKTDPEMGKRIGFIAQEVEEILPELVFTNEVDGYKGVNYAEMTAVLVEAIKEQQKQIEELKMEIEALKR